MIRTFQQDFLRNAGGITTTEKQQPKHCYRKAILDGQHPYFTERFQPDIYQGKVEEKKSIRYYEYLKNCLPLKQYFSNNENFDDGNRHQK